MKFQIYPIGPKDTFTDWILFKIRIVIENLHTLKCFERGQDMCSPEVSAS